jgi:hypothetical protein
MSLLEMQAFLFRSVTANGLVSRMIDDGILRDPAATTDMVSGVSSLADFSLEARLQARRMGQVYELLYCLENSVRELVERTLRESLGPEAWWDQGVDEAIRKGAEKRKQDDLRARWHGPRGESLLNYVDFPQYAEIIVARWSEFEVLIGDKDWLANYFGEMNRTRRALAHTGTLTEADVERMELRVREWVRVVG